MLTSYYLLTIFPFCVSVVVCVRVCVRVSVSVAYTREVGTLYFCVCVRMLAFYFSAALHNAHEVEKY